ncbi:cellulose biosynthesis cyclic di-GMP-binding regulatory protein BcsB [Phormidesmis sp. 146-35]
MNRRSRILNAFILGILLSSLGWQLFVTPPQIAQAQTPPPDQPAADTAPDAATEMPPPKSPNVEPIQPQEENPQPGTVKPTEFIQPAKAGQYVLEFNRSPIVGHRLRLQGIYDEARLQVTRPQNWQPKSAKVMLRFRHSPALYATRSNLTVLVNGTSVGSVPLNRKEGELADAVYDVPTRILQDYNEIVIAALQNNSPTCTQDPFDPSLWTEVLPDSKLVFDFEPQPVALDFNRYPYPLYDKLSLEPNQISYLLPDQMNETWLTTTARLQASLGRLAQFRPIETRLLKASDPLQPNEKLVIVGTPKAQPILTKLKAPIAFKNGQILDQKQQPLPADVGVLFWTKVETEKLVLVATGNGEAGVAKAVQFLIQARDRQLGTGQTLIIQTVDEVPTPPLREWPAYLPTTNSFNLSDLRDFDNKPFSDVTVRGAEAPPIEIDFRALPDDRFKPGNVVDLRFSYSPQVNPLTSMMEVQLDGVAVQGNRLDSDQGAVRQTMRLTLPEDRIKPFSKLQVRFQLDPRERRSCNRATDQQLWATLHNDTHFDLKRDTLAQVPDLQLLQYGFPFAAPQDLSRTAIVVPENPTSADLLLMLELSERLGRISRAESVKLDVYQGKLPNPIRNDRHLIALGTRNNLPLTQGFESGGFNLKALFSRQLNEAQLQTLSDEQGVIKEIVSPWNADRVLLTLSGQTDKGLAQVRDLLSRDDLFYQLKNDTVLIKANTANPSPYDPQAYSLEFLQNARQTRELTDANVFGQLWRSLWNNWFTIAPFTIVASLLLYAIFQSYLKRFSQPTVDSELEKPVRRKR